MSSIYSVDLLFKSTRTLFVKLDLRLMKSDESDMYRLLHMKQLSNYFYKEYETSLINVLVTDSEKDIGFHGTVTFCPRHFFPGIRRTESSDEQKMCNFTS